MNPRRARSQGKLIVGIGMLVVACAAMPGRTPDVHAQTTVRSLRSDVAVRKVLDTGVASPSIRIAQDPRYAVLYYLKQNGDMYRVDLASASSALVYTTLNHTVKNPQGFAIGRDGTMYLVGNEDRPSTQTRATIVKGVLDARGQRNWSILAQTADYPRSFTAYDHRFNGIVVDPAGSYVYVNSGSRTDHGEIQTAGGLYPNTREVGLTAAILRLPTAGQNLALPNDRAALKAGGYIFAEGTRNSFDLAFTAGDALFATENGPDRDMADELNWLRAGGHYGFPWRIGGADNPQQYPSYDPGADRLLDPRFNAVKQGYYQNDPTFPARPSTPFTEPIANQGPDADSYRDPADGQIKDASALGQTISTFTAHRSPLGLVFDTNGALGSNLNGTGLMLSWTKGDDAGSGVAGPFRDPSEDLVQLALVKTSTTSYAVRTTRIAGGFSAPIDAELLGTRLYVLEYGGTGGLWELSFPAAANLVQNGSFETTGAAWLSPWTFRNDAGGTLSQDATTKSSGSVAAKVTTTQAANAPWLIQLSQKNKALTAGKTYTITFWAKAAASRPIEVTLQQAVTPYAIHFTQSVTLTTAWQEYRLRYTATGADANAALRFNLAQAAGTVWLDNVWLRTVDVP